MPYEEFFFQNNSYWRNGMYSRGNLNFRECQIRDFVIRFGTSLSLFGFGRDFHRIWFDSQKSDKFFRFDKKNELRRGTIQQQLNRYRQLATAVLVDHCSCPLLAGNVSVSAIANCDCTSTAISLRVFVFLSEVFLPVSLRDNFVGVKCDSTYWGWRKWRQFNYCKERISSEANADLLYASNDSPVKKLKLS